MYTMLKGQFQETAYDIWNFTLVDIKEQQRNV